MIKSKCENCGISITNNNYFKHYNSCINRKKKTEFKQIDDLFECPECKKLFKKFGIATHYWFTHSIEGVNQIIKMKNNGAWNKGLTKYTSELVLKNSESVKNYYTNNSGSFTGRVHSDETKLKLKTNRLINKGGRCKWYDTEKINGDIVKVQGTYEVRFTKILNIIDPNWIKPTNKNPHRFEWIDKNNEIHYYTPDFWCPNLNEYFEVKGRWWGDDKNKMTQVIKNNPYKKINIIEEEELKSLEKKYLGD